MTANGSLVALRRWDVYGGIVMPIDPLSATLWSMLFQTIGTAAGKKIADDVIVPVLQQAVGVQSAEVQLLAEIRQDIRALIEGPWRTGDLYLQDAAQEGRPSLQRAESIEQARRKYLEACGNLHLDHFSRALVEYRVGLCWLCLGSAPDAGRWLEATHQSATKARDELTERLQQQLDRENIIDKARGYIDKATLMLQKADVMWNESKGTVVTATVVTGAVGALIPPLGLPLGMGLFALGATKVAEAVRSGGEERLPSSPQARQTKQELLQVEAFLSALTRSLPVARVGGNPAGAAGVLQSG